MNLLFYAILFVIGVGIGNIWAIQANKIPEDLAMRKTHHSNKINEKLISKLTYMIIGGVSSVVLANVLKINIYDFDFAKITIYIFSMLYISTLVLVAGIDRRYSKIEKSMLTFGIISSIIYMLYLCVVDLASIYLNSIYLAIYLVLLMIDAFLLRKYAKDSYIIDTLLLLMIIVVFTNLNILIDTVIMAIIAIAIYALILSRQKKKKGHKKLKINEIPVGYFISASNIIVLFMTRFLQNYCS